jgi:hypothetical protein
MAFDSWYYTSMFDHLNDFNITFDRGSEFIGHEFKMMLNDYGVKKTYHYPQSAS